MSFCRRAFIFLTLFSFSFLTVEAQNYGVLQGTVTDQNGAAIAGATLTVASKNPPLSRESKTGAQGDFKFESLPFGVYKVTISAKDFNSLAKEVRFDSEALANDFQLSVSPVSASVTVESETPEIELKRVPGGTALVPRREIQQTLATSLKDVLNFTPGVLAQPRYGSDEAQLSIRGSGLRNNYHARGVNILINGLSYGDADGFSDFESLEFLTAKRVEVWKGANALRYGGNTAGGAINLVTETGETAFPLEVRLQGGSFGSYKGYLSTGGEQGRFGYFVGVSDSELKGYREHGDQGRRRLFGNFTFKASENTDFYADLVYANFAENYPGALTFSEFKTDPRAANPENVTQNYGRFANYYRAAFGLKKRFGRRHEFSFNISAQYRDLIHPIFNFLDQDTRTFGGEFRYSYTGLKNRFVAGFAPQTTLTGGRRFENERGVRGAQAAQFDWVATNYGFYFENQFDFSPKFTLVAGGRVDFSKRRNTDFFLSDGDNSDRRNYRALTPKAGIVYRAKENISVFANISRSYEPPLILELTSFSFNAGFLPLEAQNTWQTEVGTRGKILNKRLDYEIAFYNSEISNEILNRNVQPFPGAPFTIPSFRSAPKTRHRGLELSTNAILARNLFASNASLNWRNAYTFADFKFTKDADFNGNYIPGQPKHLLRSELRYDHPKKFWISPNVDWSPAAYFVNSANTFRNESYAVFNLRAGYDRARYGIFFEANNLSNRIYSASVIVDDAANRFYEPANGRSAYIGFYLRLGKK